MTYCAQETEFVSFQYRSAAMPAENLRRTRK